MVRSTTSIECGPLMQVNVIGAGVVGLCVATELARRGMGVALVDREPAPGPHSCSWWAGGMLAPWCERESAEEPVLRLGMEALDWWSQIVPVARTGTLVLALDRDRKKLDQFARRTSGFEVVDGDAVTALEPDLAGRFDRGLYFAREAHIAPRDALAALHEGLAARGIVVRDRVPASEYSVDCRGLAAADTLKDLRGVKGEMLLIRCPDMNLTRTVRLLHPRIPLYIVPRGDGVYMVGATMIESGERDRITARSLLEMLSAAYALHPAFAEAEILEIGVDARPAFPDNLPRIRRDGTTIRVNGLYRHGFLLSPSLARMIADFLLNGTIPEVMDENRP